MSNRSDVLDHTVLGVLADGPLHGYELRKRMTAILGPFRALSFGSLYPCLHRLTRAGLIEQSDEPERMTVTGKTSRRSRIEYSLTPAGKEAFAEWVADAGPGSWEDEAFAARMAFFSRTDAQVRLRILEGRRARLEERMRLLERSLQRTNDQLDLYAERLQRHTVDGAAREVTWIEELIEMESGARVRRREARRSRSTKGKATP